MSSVYYKCSLDSPVYNFTEIAIFADETAIYRKNENINYDILSVNKHLKLINQWLTKWKIRINESKCITVMFTTKQRTSYINSNIYTG